MWKGGGKESTDVQRTLSSLSRSLSLIGYTLPLSSPSEDRQRQAARQKNKRDESGRGRGKGRKKGARLSNLANVAKLEEEGRGKRKLT